MDRGRRYGTFVLAWTTRTCAVSNGTGAEAAEVPCSADIGLNGGYSRWPVTEMMVCFNAQFGCA